MSTNLIQPSFSSGELSPALYGRVDLAKYHVGAATMRNFFVDYKGGASSRPGTQFIGTVDSAGITRLIPFVFSSTQQYILVFGPLYIEFIRNPLTAHYPNSSNSGFILSGMSRYSVVTPYIGADLFKLEFTQSADIMQITHPSYARMILSRITDTNWTLTSPVTGSSSASPTTGNAAVSALQAGSADPLTTTYLHTVTAIDQTGQESNTDPFFLYSTGLDIAAV